MQRTNVILLKPNKLQKKILKELMLLSSCVYNNANYIIRQQFYNKEKISSFYTLQQQLQNTKDYQSLGRSYALPRIQLYAETNLSRCKLIRSRAQRKVGLPRYYKNRKTNTTIPSYLVMDNCQYSIKKNYVFVPLSRQMRKKYSIKHFKIKYNGILKWKGKQKRAQIRFNDNKFYFHQCINLKDISKIKSNIKAGLDLGIKRRIAIKLSNNQDLLIGNKRSFRYWKHLTEKISKLQTKLKKNNNKYNSQEILKLFSKRKKYLNNIFNNYVAKIFRFLRKNNVSILVIGNVKGILNDNNKGKVLNQMMHNYWSFDLLLKKIENKAEEYGIKIKKETEEYTSQTCPICGDKNKPKDRIYICSFCGFVEHRDIVGSMNILTKSTYGSDWLCRWESIRRDEAIPLEVVVQ